MKKGKKGKIIISIVTAFIIALFGYSAYSAYYVFDDMATSEVVLYSVLISLCNAVIISLHTVFDKKRVHSKAEKIKAPVITALITAGVCFGTAYGMSALGLVNSIGSFAVAFSSILFCVSLTIFFASVFESKGKVFNAIAVMIMFIFAYALNAANSVFDEMRAEDLALCTTLISLCNAGIIFLYTLCDKKHKHSTTNKIISTAVTALVTAGVCLGTVFALDTNYLNGCIGSFAVAFALILFGISLAIYFNSLSRSSHKALYKIVAAVLAIALLGEGTIMTIKTSAEFSMLNMFYGLKVSQDSIGGTKTEDSEIVYDFALSTEKPLRNTKLGTDTEMSISLAKNEWEGFQIFFSTAANGKKVSLEVTDFKNAEGKTLETSAYKEYYSKIYGHGDKYCCEYADALVPVSFTKEPYGGAAELSKGLMQGFYIRTFAPSDAAAGEYFATLTAKNEADEIILEKEIKATVTNFTLPETPSSESAFGNTSWSEALYQYNNVDMNDEEATTALNVQYYELLLENRITPYFLPYDILDERADAYMSDPRVTSFEIPYPDDDELLVQYYEKVTSNPEWAKKGYFYPIDEPNTTEAYERYLEITDRLNRLCPGYNMVTPFSADADIELNGETVSSVKIQTGRSSILCPVSSSFDEKEDFDRLKESNKSGSRLWWYVCCVPTGDYCNLFIYQDAIKHRLLLWQQKMNNMTGLLYWSTSYYTQTNPWESGRTYESYDFAGDGCLLYPGGYIGLDEPVMSLRFVNLADGMEDYDYLTLAAERFGEDWVNEKIAKITTSLTEYTSDHELLQAVRNEIGTALSK